MMRSFRICAPLLPMIPASTAHFLQRCDFDVLHLVHLTQDSSMVSRAPNRSTKSIALQPRLKYLISILNVLVCLVGSAAAPWFHPFSRSLCSHKVSSRSVFSSIPVPRLSFCTKYWRNNIHLLFSSAGLAIYFSLRCFAS